MKETPVGMMDGMGAMMGGMGLLWLFIVILAVLGILVLARYILSGPKR